MSPSHLHRQTRKPLVGLKRTPDDPEYIPDSIISDSRGGAGYEGDWRGGSKPKVSLGTSTMSRGSTVLSLPSLSTVYDAANLKAQIALLRKAVRRNKPQIQENLPVAVAKPIPPPPCKFPPCINAGHTGGSSDNTGSET